MTSALFRVKRNIEKATGKKLALQKFGKENSRKKTEIEYENNEYLPNSRYINIIVA